MRSLRLMVACILCIACQKSRAGEPALPGPVSAPQPIQEMIWGGGLKNGWYDYGWAPHDPESKGPAEMSFADYGGWILAKPGLKGEFGGLRFRYQAPDTLKDFLEVRLDSTSSEVFPRIRPQARHRLPGAAWIDIFIPIEELNPEGKLFDRVVLRAYKEVPDVKIRFDQIGLAAPDPRRRARNGRAGIAVGPRGEAELRFDCGAPSHPISRLVYGIAYAPRLDNQDRQQWSLGATARRWGGNPTSRYNWELGNAWNTGSDYFYRNVNYTGDPTFTYDKFLDANLAAGMKTALTVPAIGFVAKDTQSYGFPVSALGPQQEVDPNKDDAGNGVSKDGKKLEPGSPSLTSVPAPPEFVEKWIRAIRKKDEQRGRSVQLYFVDNEPELWNDTHRDVHPQPTSYNELLERTVAYARAIRKADPEALIAGPSPWGWPAYFGSAVDEAAKGAAPDRKAHGNVPLLAWYLRKLREHEKKTGERLLDVVDVHFYPQAKGIGSNVQGKTDPATSALRIRSTRALWDPTYRDESWIDDKIALIPRLKAWIAENYPGRGISIGEYNFGAETHMSGGLAVAEALGRFGEQGVTAAFYWTYPAADSPAFWAFRAFRNYDGKGAQFGDVSIPAQAPGDLSFFVSWQSDSQRYVGVLLNKSPKEAFNASVIPSACSPLRIRRVFTYVASPKGFEERAGPFPNLKVEGIPPYSMSVIELERSGPGR